MTIVPIEVEEKTIRAFIRKDKQERCCLLLATPKRRREFTREFAHFKWLDERFATPIPPNVVHTAEQMISVLRRKGAGRTVWAISADPAIDSTELLLEDAIRLVLGSDWGTILSCIPGKLGFFRGEEINSERLLER